MSSAALRRKISATGVPFLGLVTRLEKEDHLFELDGGAFGREDPRDTLIQIKDPIA
jgi:hypothetical protein